MFEGVAVSRGRENNKRISVWVSNDDYERFENLLIQTLTEQPFSERFRNLIL
jgi:hypothetical protein